MSFPQGYIDALLGRADIVEVINTFLPLKPNARWKNWSGSPRDGEYITLCPFHKDKTPGFTVSSTKQFFHCFECGAHGTVIDFLVEYQYWEFYDAVMYLAKRYHYYPRQYKSKEKKKNS